jgi:predicted GH43/DUF377 family glycosyl hydrolase
MKFFLIFLCCATAFGDLIDFEDNLSEFVLETKRIEIPGFPDAFNPSIISWRGYTLMSFRFIPDPKRPFTSHLGLVFLDDEFNPMGQPYALNLRDAATPSPCRAEDARLIIVGDQLYMIYSDNIEDKISKGGFRMHIVELHFDGEQFSAENIERLTRYEGESSSIREKNWVPFVYNGDLLLAYSIVPHRIFRPIADSCETLCVAETPIHWDWGELRGGTQAQLVDGQYLAFFHSAKKLESIHSDGKTTMHYFIGAYTFSPFPPFTLTQISPHPIVGRNFYHGLTYKPYWGPVNVVFPCGYIFDQNAIWLTYGRQDRECWIAKIDKRGLMRSLTR